MFGTHTIINVKYLGNQKGMTYFCDSNIFGVLSKYFPYLPFDHPVFLMDHSGMYIFRSLNLLGKLLAPDCGPWSEMFAQEYITFVRQ